MAAFSGESEAWTMFSCPLMPKSPRIVPGVALRALVAPVMARTTATASTPFIAITITGVSHHRTQNAWEEGAVDEVGVVFAQDIFGQLGHLHSGDDEAFSFEAGDDISNKAALHG